MAECTTPLDSKNPAEENLTQPFRFELLAGEPVHQRLRIAIPLRSPRAARTLDARGRSLEHVPNNSEENVPMTERIPVRAEVGGLAELLLPHLNAAYNLARWLVRNAEDAEDVVQEAYLRAFQYSGFRGGNARAWLLTIVRNTSYGWLRKRRAYESIAQFDEEIHTSDNGPWNPEELLVQNADGRLAQKALSELPTRFREILVLRELEDLSYKEIADVLGVPIGTVMSMLSRARDRFRRAAGDLLKPQNSSESDSPAVKVRECVGAGSCA
jgi:RNA polymerase sigma-70 factor (ECF subfamily)